MDLPAKVAFGPNDGVELAAELCLQCLNLCEERGHVGTTTHDEHVDVAADVIVTAGVRAEDESEPDAGTLFEDPPKLRYQPDRAGVELAERQIHGIGRIHPPHSQRPQTLALDQALPQELLKGELDRTWRAVDPTNELTRVEFLSRRAGQKSEEPRLGCRASDVGHPWHSNTCVLIWNTPVSFRRATPAPAACK